MKIEKTFYSVPELEAMDCVSLRNYRRKLGEEARIMKGKISDFGMAWNLVNCELRKRLEDLQYGAIELEEVRKNASTAIEWDFLTLH